MYIMIEVIGVVLTLFGIYCSLMMKGSDGQGGFGCFAVVSILAGPLLCITAIASCFSNGEVFDAIICILIPVAALIGIAYLMKKI